MTETRYIKIEREDAYNDGGNGSDTRFLKVASADYQTEIEHNEIEEMNRPTLEESYQVLREGGGSFDMWGRADALPMLLEALFGDVTVVDTGTGGVAPYQANFVPDQDGIFSLAVKEGKPKNQYDYPGQLVNEVEITAEIGETLTISVSTLGNGAVDTSAKETPDYIDPDNCPLFTLKNTTIDLGGDKRADVKSITITYSNEISEDEHSLGSLDLQYKPPAQRRSIEVEFEFAEEDSDLFDDFIAGTEAELELTFETDQTINGEYPYGMTWIFPRLQYREWDASQSGRDPVRTSVPAVALYERDYTYNKGEGATATVDTEVICKLSMSDQSNLSVA